MVRKWSFLARKFPFSLKNSIFDLDNPILLRNRLLIFKFTPRDTPKAIFDQNWHIWNEWFNNFGMRPRVSAFSALLAVRSQFLTFWNQKLSFLTFFELHFYGRQWIKFLVGWSVDYSRFWESWFMPSRFDSWKFIKIQTNRSNRNNREFNKIIKMSKNENSRNFRKNNQ